MYAALLSFPAFNIPRTGTLRKVSHSRHSFCIPPLIIAFVLPPVSCYTQTTVFSRVKGLAGDTPNPPLVVRYSGKLCPSAYDAISDLV